MTCPTLAPLSSCCLVVSGVLLAGCSFLDPNDDSVALSETASVVIAEPTAARPDFGVRVLQPGSDVANLTVTHRHVLVPSSGVAGYLTASAARINDFMLVAQGASPPSSGIDAARPPEHDATFRAWSVYCNNGEGAGDEGMSTAQWDLVDATTIPAELVAGCKPPK